MRRKSPLLVLAPFVALLASCASYVETANRPREPWARPLVLALARPEADPAEPVQADRVLAEIDRTMREQGVRIVPGTALQQAVARIAADRRHPTDPEYAAAAAEVFADVVLVVDRLHYPGGSYVLFTYRALAGRARCLRAATAEVLWQAEVVEREVDGPGQDIQLVIATVFSAFGEEDRDSAARVYHSFAQRLATEMRTEFPGLRDETASDGPVVRSVALGGGPRPAALTVDDAVVVEARGTSGCTAEALLPGVEGRFPLTETSSGIYRGTILIPPGLGTVHGAVTVRLRDSLHRYGGRRTTELLAIESPMTPPHDESLLAATDASAFRALAARTPRAALLDGRRTVRAVPAGADRTSPTPATGAPPTP